MFFDLDIFFRLKSLFVNHSFCNGFSDLETFFGLNSTPGRVRVGTVKLFYIPPPRTVKLFYGRNYEVSKSAKGGKGVFLKPLPYSVSLSLPRNGFFFSLRH